MGVHTGWRQVLAFIVGSVRSRVDDVILRRHGHGIGPLQKGLFSPFYVRVVRR